MLLSQINAFYLQKEAELKGRMRTLIDKRKNIQMHLGGTLSRSSAAFNALYDGLRYFERDLSKLQVGRSAFLAMQSRGAEHSSAELHRNERYGLS